MSFPLRLRQFALAVLAVLCLVSLGMQSDLVGFYSQLGRVQEDEIIQEIARVRCIEDDLPQDVLELGFMPNLPRRMEDPNITNSTIRLRSRDYRALYLSQFALAPRLVWYYDRGDWIVGSFPDRETGLEAIELTPYQIVKDCGTGVFLLRK